MNHQNQTETVFLNPLQDRCTRQNRRHHHPRLLYFIEYVNSAFSDSFGATVTFIVCSPIFSWTAASVYVPAGRPLISNRPSASVTAKNGVADTLMNAFIHG